MIDLERLLADVDLPDLLTLREATDADEPGLLRLYCVLRTPEFDHLAWPQDSIRHLLESQFEIAKAQDAKLYPEMQRFVLIDRYGPAGELVIAQEPDRLRIVKIALLPAYQGRGTGTSLVVGVLAQAAEQQCDVRVSLPPSSPFRNQLTRLGFRQMVDSPMGRMHWSATWAGKQPGTAGSSWPSGRAIPPGMQ